MNVGLKSCFWTQGKNVKFLSFKEKSFLFVETISYHRTIIENTVYVRQTYDLQDCKVQICDLKHYLWNRLWFDLDNMRGKISNLT